MRIAVLTAALTLALPTAASAQVHVMGRQDKTDVVYTVNQQNGLAKTKEKADAKGGSWSLLLESDECGHGAIWYATNGEVRKYFIVVGKPTVKEATEDASRQARGYAEGKAGWHAGIMRVFLNENRYPLRPTTKDTVVGTVYGPKVSCMEGKSNQTGVRG